MSLNILYKYLMKTFRLGVLLSLLVLLGVGCSSDDNSTKDDSFSEVGYFTFDGKEYSLKAGIIHNEEDFWSDDGSTEYEISLLSTEVILASDGDIIPIDTIFSGLEFVVFSEDDSKPKTGRYLFNEEENKNFTCSDMYGFINVDYNLDDEESDDDDFEEDIDAIEGYIEILQSGEIYELEFEFENYDGKPIKGYYKGALLIDAYDY